MAMKKTARRNAAEKTRRPPMLTSPDKLLFPESGIRKRDVVEYYAAVMDWLLPEIVGRRSGATAASSNWLP